MLNLKDVNIIKLNNGDKDEFSKFYLRTVDFFFRRLKGMYFLEDNDINDLLSEYYYKIWTNVGKLPTKEEDLKKWLRIVFKNLVYDFFKKGREKYFSDFYYQNDDSDNNNFEDNLYSEDSLLDSIDKELKLNQIKEALNKLSDTYKEVLFLKYIEGYSNSEISDLLGISEDTVRKRLSRGIQKLKQFLQ